MICYVLYSKNSCAHARQLIICYIGGHFDALTLPSMTTISTRKRPRPIMRMTSLIGQIVGAIYLLFHRFCIDE
jgi:hypothetical protein